MIGHNHPAVKAMIAPRLEVGCASDKAADLLNAALQLLGPDDLRDTPAGNDLKFEGWQEGYELGVADMNTAMNTPIDFGFGPQYIHPCRNNPYKKREMIAHEEDHE